MLIIQAHAGKWAVSVLLACIVLRGCCSRVWKPLDESCLSLCADTQLIVTQLMWWLPLTCLHIVSYTSVILAQQPSDLHLYEHSQMVCGSVATESFYLFSMCNVKVESAPDAVQETKHKVSFLRFQAPIKWKVAAMVSLVFVFFFPICCVTFLVIRQDVPLLMWFDWTNHMNRFGK